MLKKQCWILRSSEGHNATCWWKGDLINIVCEYEVNQLTNDKDITEIQKLTQNDKLLKNNVKCQGHLKVNVACL